jgi:hypothetical protein
MGGWPGSWCPALGSREVGLGQQRDRDGLRVRDAAVAQFGGDGGADVLWPGDDVGGRAVGEGGKESWGYWLSCGMAGGYGCCW